MTSHSPTRYPISAKAGNIENFKVLPLHRIGIIMNYLSSDGIQVSRLSAKDYGMEHHIVSDDVKRVGERLIEERG